ncbi:MAG: MFS transporter, partial [Paraburkholderia tropica]
LFIVLPVANLTFRIFDIDEFTHGYRLKNIVRQLTISFATATVIIVEQHRLALHQTRLVEFVNPLNPIFQDTFAKLTHTFEALGRSPGEAHGLALAQVSRMVAQQASFLSSLDGFYYLMGAAIVGAVFAAWQKQID